MRYLDCLAERRIDPNFWCSEEYLRAAGVVEQVVDNFLVVTDRDVILFPPMWADTKVCHFPLPGIEYDFPVWSDFYEFSMEKEPNAVFLDHEYLYDPTNFTRLEGGAWSVFRKNSRKWPRAHPTHFFRYLLPGECSAPIARLLGKWLDANNRENTMQDVDAFADLCFSAKRRMALMYKGEVVGLMTYDESWKYINFRICICKEEPYLNEYMRLSFYTTASVLHSGKWVNDGGSLGIPGIERFKDKLQPIRKRLVHGTGGNHVG